MSPSPIFDTHCHLNFKRFKKSLDQVIQASRAAGIGYFVVPGTDIKSSQTAIQIAKQYDGIYAAVGIHPHHVFNYIDQPNQIFTDIDRIKQLAQDPTVVAIGEIGLDLHDYQHTKYPNYHTNPDFLKLQQKVFFSQLKIAIDSQLPFIIHNREAAQQTLKLLQDNWQSQLDGKCIFHCCEPSQAILDFAIQHNCYLGVDGDITYDPQKQHFITQIPYQLLLVETDSPYLLPEPLRTQRQFPNTPANLPLIIGDVAALLNTDPQTLIDQTTQNAKRVFNIIN